MYTSKVTNGTRLQKNRRFIKYLKETVYLPLVIGTDGSRTLTWNIDASFAVHPDCKSHNEAYLILRHGSLLSLLSKQNINTKSSTEAELVGVNDAMTFVIWMKNFFESQVRSTNKNSPLKHLESDVTLEQDNTSVIQLERNRWKSSSKRTKYIAIRYFYITNRLKPGDVNRVIYKPTEEMTSNYSTKAL